MGDAENKFVQLQHQIKQNNSELQDFLKEMDSWEKDIKEKDVQLKQEKSLDGQNLPPVRNSLEKKRKKKKKKVKKQTEVTAGEKKPISGYDFRAWDKFDVEAECKKVDDAVSSSPDEYETDEEWEIERMRLLANQHKEQGNDKFKNGDFVEAVECYTRGIECDPESAILPANRAMALLKLERYAAAELDCTRSLTLDPGYVKALHRRGQARAALKKYAEAKEDFTEVLKKESKNRQAKAELEKVERLLNPPKLLQSKNLDASDAGIVKAVYKPPNQRSKKPLKRMQIEEIGEDEESEKRRQQMSSAYAKQSETRKTITQKDNQKFDKLTQNIAQEKAVSGKLPDQKNKGSGLPENEGRLVEELSESGEAKELTSDVPSRINGTSEQPIDTLPTEKPASCDKKLMQKVESPESSSPSVSPRVPPVPTSSFQFQADWKVLKDTEEKFFQYFKEINPSTFPKLFGQFLDADVLMKIFTTLSEFYIVNNLHMYPVLFHLCQVKRFSMTVMFMSASDKSVLRKLFDHMEQKENRPTAELKKLKTSYGL